MSRLGGAVVAFRVDLVALSSVGKLVVALESDHEIQLYQPDLVVQAIRDVIGEIHEDHGHARHHLQH